MSTNTQVTEEKICHRVTESKSSAEDSSISISSLETKNRRQQEGKQIKTTIGTRSKETKHKKHKTFKIVIFFLAIFSLVHLLRRKDVMTTVVVSESASPRNSKGQNDDGSNHPTLSGGAEDTREGGDEERAQVKPKTSNATQSSSSSSSGGFHHQFPPLLSPNMTTIPNVLLIGTQKGGTTALANWMKTQLGICNAKKFPGEPPYFDKEVHFFDHSTRYSQGVSFYAKRFRHCFNNAARYAMDATPNTMLHPERIHEIYKQINNHREQRSPLKLILVVREPASRMLSMYNHMVSEVVHHNYAKLGDVTTQWYGIVAKDETGKSLLSFQEFVTQNVINIHNNTNERRHHESFYSGSYGDAVERLSKEFDRSSQLLILGYDELKLNPTKVQWRVKAFLGIQMSDHDDNNKNKNFATANNKASKYKVSKMDCDTQNLLLKEYQPLNDDFYHFLEANSGPAMEARPFPKFVVPSCVAIANASSSS